MDRFKEDDREALLHLFSILTAVHATFEVIQLQINALFLHALLLAFALCCLALSRQ